MDELLKVISDDRVSLARVEKDNRGNNQQLDKEQVKRSLEVKKKIGEVAQILEELDEQGKKEWLSEAKKNADSLYKEGKFQKAMEAYLEGLMGLREDLDQIWVREYKATERF